MTYIRSTNFSACSDGKELIVSIKSNSFHACTFLFARCRYRCLRIRSSRTFAGKSGHQPRDIDGTKSKSYRS